RPGPRRFQLDRAPAGWGLKAVLMGGSDISDAAIPLGGQERAVGDIEVVLTDRITRLTGHAADKSGRSVPDYSALIFSVDRNRWYPDSRFMRMATPGREGTFDVQGMPAGEYFVAAAVDPIVDAPISAE